MKTLSKFKNAIKLTVIILLIAPSICLAQLSSFLNNMDSTLTLTDIKSNVEQYLDSLELATDSATFYAEGGEYIEYKKFIRYWEPKIGTNGSFIDIFNADSLFYYHNHTNYFEATSDEWHEIGPYERPGVSSDGIGPIESIDIFDDGTNVSTKYMLVASLLGGVYHSTDYGESWSSTSTDTQWEQSGAGCAIFYPTDHTTWFASSSGNSNSGYPISIGKIGGIYRTKNQGQDWTKIADHIDLGGIWTSIYKLLIVQGSPEILFAVTSNGIYKSENFNNPNNTPTWIKVWNNRSYDIEVKPDNNQLLYATSFYDGNWKIIKSSNKGASWAPIQYQPKSVTSSEIKHSSYTIEVSKARPDYLYALATDNYSSDLYYYDFASSQSSNLVSTSSFTTYFGMGHAFGVEQASNGNEVICSKYTTLKIFDITNPGTGTNKSQHHADVEDVVYHPYNLDEVWLCTHGGAEKSINGGYNWTPKYSGLTVANVEELATSVTNPELIMIGLYHDHTQLTESPYIENWKPDWKEAVSSGDGMRPLIDPIDPLNMWASWQEGRWYRSSDGFSTYQTKTLKSDFYTEGVLNKIAPSKIYRHAYSDPTNETKTEVYLTESSNDQAISAFQLNHADGYYVIGLFTPYTNGDQLYVTLQDKLTKNFHLYRTINVNDPVSSIVWSEIQLPRTEGWVHTIDFDPYDENIVYIVYGNSLTDGDYSTGLVYKVDYTNTNQPISTDLSNNLPNTTTGKECIEIDNGYNRGIYLFTTYGVFYTNNDLIGQGFNCWQTFGENLPHTRGGSLEINYVSNKLRAGLFGRGVWEIDLPCISDIHDEAITNDDTWDEDLRVSGTVTINAQKSLTIQNCVTSFAPGAKIIVEPGAKLIVNNSRLTNTCGGPWAGIEVWGNSNAHQYPDANGNYQQGYVELKNGAIVENAW